MVSSNLELCPSKIKHRELMKHVDEMVDLYVNQNLSTRKIALKFNTEKGVVARILKDRGVQLHGGRTRDYNLFCQECGDAFSSKCPTRLRCGACDYKERNRQARDRFRAKNAKHVTRGNICCDKCGNKIKTTRIHRRFCDSCRQVRLNDLRRLRRAKNPEKYRLKDKQYNARSYAGHIAATNRRVKQYGKSILKVELIRSVFEADNYVCQYCYKRGGNLTVDHIVPLCCGGANDDTNLVTACRTCNLSKNRKSLLNFLLFINARERN